MAIIHKLLTVGVIASILAVPVAMVYPKPTQPVAVTKPIEQPKKVIKKKKKKVIHKQAPVKQQQQFPFGGSNG